MLSRFENSKSTDNPDADEIMKCYRTKTKLSTIEKTRFFQIPTCLQNASFVHTDTHATANFFAKYFFTIPILSKHPPQHHTSLCHNITEAIAEDCNQPITLCELRTTIDSKHQTNRSGSRSNSY